MNQRSSGHVRKANGRDNSKSSDEYVGEVLSLWDNRRVKLENAELPLHYHANFVQCNKTNEKVQLIQAEADGRRMHLLSSDKANWCKAHGSKGGHDSPPPPTRPARQREKPPSINAVWPQSNDISPGRTVTHGAGHVYLRN